MRNRLFIFGLALVSSLAFGINEADLNRDYAALVTPLFSLGTSGKLVGQKGVELRYRAFPRKEGKGVVVIVPGYTENYLKYPELIYDLWTAGYSVYIMDHRGMGLSGRMAANRQVVHVEQLSYYVSDLQKFVDEVVSQDRLADKKYVVAHSMGGLVTAHLMARRPNLFRAAILNAPLLDLNTGKYPRSVAVALATALVDVGRGAHYAPGYGDFDLAKFTLEASPVTQSPTRFSLFRNTLIEHPELRMGGPSARWVKIMLAETRASRVEALAAQMRTPILMFQPGKDTYVLPRGQNIFCGIALDCKKMVFPGAKHETLREKDEFRAPAVKATLEFLDNH